MFKLRKLNASGFAHHLILAAVVLVVGVGGTYELVHSHAQTCGSSTSGSSTSASATSGSAASGSCTTGTKTPGHGWQLLASGTTNETNENVYACVDEFSPTKWTVRGLGTLVPAVKDSSPGYSMGLTVGTAKSGGAATSRTWWLNEVTEVITNVNPTLGTYSVTPSMSAPTAHPFIKGGGGGPTIVANLIAC